MLQKWLRWVLQRAGRKQEMRGFCRAHLRPDLRDEIRPLLSKDRERFSYWEALVQRRTNGESPNAAGRSAGDDVPVGEVPVPQNVGLGLPRPAQQHPGRGNGGAEVSSGPDNANANNNTSNNNVVDNDRAAREEAERAWPLRFDAVAKQHAREARDIAIQRLHLDRRLRLEREREERERRREDRAARELGQLVADESELGRLVIDWDPSTPGYITHPTPQAQRLREEAEHRMMNERTKRRLQEQRAERQRAIDEHDRIIEEEAEERAQAAEVDDELPGASESAGTTSSRSETAPDPDLMIVGSIPASTSTDVAIIDSVPSQAIRMSAFAENRRVVAEMEDEKRQLESEIREIVRRGRHQSQQYQRAQSSGKSHRKRKFREYDDDRSGRRRRR